MEPDVPQPSAAPPKGRRALKWVAAAGFWFFLLKGLAWLALPAVLAWLGWG